MSDSRELSKSDVRKVEKFLHDLDLPKEEFGPISFHGHKPTWKNFKKKTSQIGIKTCSAMVYLLKSFLIGQDLIIDQGISLGSKLPTIVSNITVHRHYSRGSEGFDYKPRNIPVVNSRGGLVGVEKCYPALSMLKNDLRGIRKPIKPIIEDPVTMFELPKNPLLGISYFFEKLFLLDALESLK